MKGTKKALKVERTNSFSSNYNKILIVTTSDSNSFLLLVVRHLLLVAWQLLPKESSKGRKNRCQLIAAAHRHKLTNSSCTCR